MTHDLTTSMPCIQFYLAAATTTHVIPTLYYHTTTSTAIVETPLDSRAQPVATEHAVRPTKPQGRLPLVIGKNRLLTTTILLLGIFMHKVQTSISAFMYRSLMGSALYIFVKEGGERSFQVFLHLSMKEHHACLFTVKYPQVHHPSHFK